MPRTPRSREEIEQDVYDIHSVFDGRIDEVSFGMARLQLMVLLDIRDAVMAANRSNMFGGGTSKHTIPEYVSVADAEEMREQGRKAKN